MKNIGVSQRFQCQSKAEAQRSFSSLVFYIDQLTKLLGVETRENNIKNSYRNHPGVRDWENGTSYDWQNLNFNNHEENQNLYDGLIGQIFTKGSVHVDTILKQNQTGRLDQLKIEQATCPFLDATGLLGSARVRITKGNKLAHLLAS